MVGINPELILSSRRINDNMPKNIVQRTMEGLVKAKKNVCNSKVLLMGFTFKENCLITEIRAYLAF